MRHILSLAGAALVVGLTSSASAMCGMEQKATMQGEKKMEGGMCAMTTPASMHEPKADAPSGMCAMCSSGKCACMKAMDKMDGMKDHQPPATEAPKPQ